MRLRSLTPFVLGLGFMLSTSAVGCMAKGVEEEDAEFDHDWTDDFENDDAEEAAEGAEQGVVDELDDLDDTEDLGEGTNDPGPSGTPFPTEGNEENATPPVEGEGGGEGGGEGEGVPEGSWEGIGEIAGGGLPAHPVRPPRRGPHGPLSIIEDDPNFSGFAGWDAAGKKVYDVAKAGERLDQAKALGADAIRIMLWWKEAVPGGANAKTKPAGFVASKPDDYDWRGVDMQIEQARRRGLKIVVTIPAGPMPYWASEEPDYCEKKGGWSCSWKPNVREYAKFVTAIGRHIKAKRYRIWAFTFVNEPNIGAFLSDESPRKTAYRYRKMWFAARKHLRATAKLTARVWFSDQANNQNELEPDAVRWRLFNESLCLKLESDPEVVPGFCPAKKRKVNASGIAFHPYAATPSKARDSVAFLQKLVDEAAQEGRIPRNRGLYMTESAFLTGRASSSSNLGAAGVVTPEQQAIYGNIVDRLLSQMPRVKSLSQYELVDEGRGTWDCGLRFATGVVVLKSVLKSGEQVAGDFLDVKLGSHITVRPAAGAARVVKWGEILMERGAAKFWSTGMGSEKPAYAAYRVSADAVRDGDNVTIYGLARADTGLGFSIEGLGASGEWHHVKDVKTDALGFGKATIPVGSLSAWRVRFVTDLSRVVK